MTGNPTRHVILALSLSAILYLIAGDRWNENIRKVGPVRVIRKGER